MTYDAQGRLSAWTAPSGTSVNEYLLYDNEGNLVLTRTVTPNGNTSPIDFGVTETVLTSSTTSTADYYFVDGQRVAEQVGSTFSYLIPNLEGSPTVALSSTGTVSAVELFLPYGASGFAWGTMPTPHNYTDQLLDSEMGLLYYGARWYDPLADQFTSADSVQGDPSGMNPYGYVGGNPETFVDPTGQMYCDSASCHVGGDIAAGNNILASAFPDGIPGYNLVGAGDPSVDSFEYDGATYTYNTSTGEIDITASDYSYGYDLFPGEAGYGDLLNKFKQAQAQAENPSDPFVGHEDSPVPTPMSPTTTTSPSSSPAPSPGGSSGGGPRPPKKSGAAFPAPESDRDRMNPNDIYFTQDSCSSSGGGYTVDGNIQALKNGSLTPDDLPAIRVFQKDAGMDAWGSLTKNGYTGDPANLVNGRWYTLDNRRLLAFIESGVDSIPVVDVTGEQSLIQSQRWKFSTTNGGDSIICE